MILLEIKMKINFENEKKVCVCRDQNDVMDVMK